MFIKIFKLKKEELNDLKMFLYDNSNHSVLQKKNAEGFNITWGEKLFKVNFYSGDNNFDTLRMKWYGSIFKKKDNIIIVNYIGLPIYFLITFLFFIVFSLHESDLVGIIFATIIFIVVSLFSSKEYFSLKDFLQNTIQEFIKS